jgi:hypothetical protein
MINLPFTNLPFSGVIYGKINHRTILVIQNKIAGVQFGFVQHTHGK